MEVGSGRRLFPVGTFLLVGFQTLAFLIIVRDRIMEVANQSAAQEVSQNLLLSFQSSLPDTRIDKRHSQEYTSRNRFSVSDTPGRRVRICLS